MSYSPPTFAPTAEQAAIVEAATNPGPSIMVTAYAGCTKTSTLEMVANALPTQPALALAFNVKIKKELEKRFPAWFEIKTLNGLGHSAWQKAIGKRCEVDEKKLGRLTTAVLKATGFEAGEDTWTAIRQLVSAAMSRGLVPSHYPHKSLIPDTAKSWRDIADDLWLDLNDSACEIARSILIESCKEAFQGIISYDDQIYMSAMFGGVFPKFPLVFVDEAQDLSPLNHIQVRRCSTGRLIVVGDPKQAIYAFRGADSESMAKLRQLRTDWIDLPLHTTFRCPKVVVAQQQLHAPGFRSAPSCAEGRWLDLRGKAWDWDFLAGLRPHANAHVAMLCRNNAPLLDMAFKLLRQGVGCMMLGRDIGKGLVTLSKKILPLDSTPGEECVKLIREWAESETRLARANEKEEKVSAIKDREECLIAVLESGGAENAGELRRKLADLFSREHGLVTLASGHRSKGLEWDVVVHLDPWRVPSKYAMRAASEGYMAPLQQEKNLRYVIQTRTKLILVEADLENFGRTMEAPL